MRKLRLIIPSLVALILITFVEKNVFAQNIVFPKIDRHPIISDFHRGKLDSIPVYNPASTNSFQVNLRGYDLSKLDLSGSLESLLYADFDDRTIWPSDDRMPGDYDPEHIMELGKNPGLGVWSLHDRSITGRGVGIAIIDQPLLVEHIEYVERLRLYEEINIDSTINPEAQMHGPAVASIACGKTVGVAPEADLYYIAANPGIWDENRQFRYDFIYYAQAVRRILEINGQLPSDRKIRVISISVGWEQGQDGYTEMTAAVKEAEEKGIFVVWCYADREYRFKFQGLGRHPLDTPEKESSYVPGMWWANSLDNWLHTQFNFLMVPMDSRTTASQTGADEYVFYREGGESWAVPWIAGVYALVCQVNPSVTPEQFWDIAMKTGRWKKVTSESGVTYSLGSIIDPPAIIGEMEKIVPPADAEDEDTNTGTLMLEAPSLNPFKPATTIGFTLPADSGVTSVVQ